MSVQCETTGRRAAGARMPFFERYLSVWVVLCIVAGIMLGQLFPSLFDALGAMEVARVNLPVAVLIWLMILPMLLKIDFQSLREVRAHWRGVGVTLFINWGVKPFSMALLAWIFIRTLFADWIHSDPRRPAGSSGRKRSRSTPLASAMARRKSSQVTAWPSWRSK